MLDEQLGLTVGVGGGELCVLGNGHGFGFAVDGGGRGEDEFLDAGVLHRFQEGKRGGGVVAEVHLRFLHGTQPASDERGEVQHAFGLRLTEDGLNSGAIGKIGLDELRTLGNGLAPAMTEIIDDGDLVAGLEQAV